jgi:hypothetical protein
MNDNNRIDRRAFLGKALLGAASVASAKGLSAEPIQEPPRAPTGVHVLGGFNGGKRLLQPTDFEYIGGFILPGRTGGQDTRFSRGLTHRYVGTDLRFFSAAHKDAQAPKASRDGGLFEFGFPGLSLKDPLPTAPILRHWGDIYQWRMAIGASFETRRPIFEKPRGLWWDEEGGRLYWSYSCGGADDGYCGVPESATLGASELNSTTGTGTGIGAWRIGPATYKCVMRGCVPIPQWFAQAHTGGRRIATGFGGYFSMMATGGVSMGPSLWAIDPPTAPHMSAIDATPLVSYNPVNPRPYTRPMRCQRPPDYTAKYDGWQPKGGIGYWTWTDSIHQGCVWIDLPDSHGIILFPVLGSGLCYYANAAVKAEKALHWWMAYDPYDLAKVAHGELARDLVVPAWWNEVRYPRVPYPTGSGWQSEWPKFFGYIPRVVGSTFDPVTRTVFLMLITKSWPSSEQTILAYKVK